MSSEYVELHCHSNYSFQEGASSISELLVRAQELKYPALALTDHEDQAPTSIAPMVYEIEGWTEGESPKSVPRHT